MAARNSLFKVDRGRLDEAPPAGTGCQPGGHGPTAAAVDDVEDPAGVQVREHDRPRLDAGDLSVLLAGEAHSAAAVLIGLQVAYMPVSTWWARSIVEVSVRITVGHVRPAWPATRDTARLGSAGDDHVLRQPRGHPRPRWQRIGRSVNVHLVQAGSTQAPRRLRTRTSIASPPAGHVLHVVGRERASTSLLRGRKS